MGRSKRGPRIGNFQDKFAVLEAQDGGWNSSLYQTDACMNRHKNITRSQQDLTKGENWEMSTRDRGWYTREFLFVSSIEDILESKYKERFRWFINHFQNRPLEDVVGLFRRWLTRHHADLCEV